MHFLRQSRTGVEYMSQERAGIIDLCLLVLREAREQVLKREVLGLRRKSVLGKKGRTNGEKI